VITQQKKLDEFGIMKYKQTVKIRKNGYDHVIPINCFLPFLQCEQGDELEMEWVEDHIEIRYMDGKLDADKVLKGISEARRQIDFALSTLKEKIDENNGNPIDEKEYISDIGTKIDKPEMFVQKLKSEGTIFNPKLGYLALSPRKQ